jgi:hypothetical protein
VKKTLWTILATALFGIVGAQTALAGSVNVVDSRGTVVGEAQSPTGTLDQVLLKIKGQWFYLQINSAEFTPTDVTLYYTNSSCSGQPYITLAFQPPPTLSLSTQNSTGGIIGTPFSGTQTLYYADLTQIQNITTNSYNFTDFNGNSAGCVNQTFTNVSAAPPKTLVLETLGFVGPFKLK